jgi:activator of HSP90 ATPase
MLVLFAVFLRIVFAVFAVFWSKTLHLRRPADYHYVSKNIDRWSENAFHVETNKPKLTASSTLSWVKISNTHKDSNTGHRQRSSERERIIFSWPPAS